MFLDSCYEAGGGGRYDIAVWQPELTLTTRNGSTVLETGYGNHSSSGDPFSLIEAQLGGPERSTELPFSGGAMGMFSYDLGRRVERLPSLAANDLPLPEMAVGIYSRCLVVDHEAQQSWYVHRGLSAAAVRAALDLLVVPRTLTPPTLSTDFVISSSVTAELSRAEYADAFTQIQRYIHDGDCYQVNFSQRFSASASGSSWDAYQRLRRLNPAPFAAFMQLPGGSVLSSSPERFLCAWDGQVEARPIKGTRRRLLDPVADQKQIASLQSSVKDRAENLMIVDLLRNDIGKVCQPGSVSVPRLFEVETCARVHHLVSTVCGRLQNGRSALDALRACFPGGSITGAPKVRAMEIIESLEPTRRSVYCGALGYVSHDGQMDMNIAIRTVLLAQGRLSCWAGGGIVLDSELEAEYQESFDKAAAMLSLFNDASEYAVGH